MEPVLHLSIPVRDVDEARAFYVDVLGCEGGRVRDGWVDVWFFGMQLTLQERPDQVVPLEAAGVRHFGVMLPADDLDVLLSRLRDDSVGGDVRWLREPSTDHAGTPQEQTKAKLADPSGNVIELKTYPDPESALEH